MVSVFLVILLAGLVFSLWAGLQVFVCESNSRFVNLVPGNEVSDNSLNVPKSLLFIQYRGKASEDFARALHQIEAPCNTVFTMRKLRSVLPSLKPAVEKLWRASVVYKLKCPRCSACYVGQTDRHFCTRLNEHQQRQDQPVYRHFKKCRRKLRFKDTEFLTATTRGVTVLETLEALWIDELKPQINTREEYKQRHLTIRLSSGLWSPNNACFWIYWMMHLIYSFWIILIILF